MKRATKGRRPVTDVADEPDVFDNEDIEDDEKEDEKAVWLRSRQTSMTRGELKTVARKLIKTICFKAQASVDNELAFLAGRLAQVDATLITLGETKSIFEDGK